MIQGGIKPLKAGIKTGINNPTTMKELTAEEFFRNKLRELHPKKESITTSKEMITAEQGLRWAHEFKELHLSSLQSKGKTKEGLRAYFESTGYSAWINADLYPDGKIYTQEYTEWLEKQVLSMESHANKDGWVSCADKKADVINIDGEWIEFEGAPNLFTEMANKNCMCRFDDGTECRYMDEHPQAVMTHFQITP